MPDKYNFGIRPITDPYGATAVRLTTSVPLFHVREAAMAARHH
jgi:hypothetical protein